MSEISTKDKLLHWAAQIDQISRELEAEASNKKNSLGAAHEIMVIKNQLIFDSTRLVKLAGLLS